MGDVLDYYKKYKECETNEHNHGICRADNIIDEDVTRLNEEERIAAENMYRVWKEKNRDVEDKIDRFMRNKVDTIMAIMEVSDRMRVTNGKVEINSEKVKKNDTNSEEIRLLKEQNELLKELLLKKHNNE